MRVTGAVLVLVTERRVVVVRPVVALVGAAVGTGVAVAAAAGWSGAFDACRFSLAKIVMPPKVLRVIAAATALSTSVDVMSGFLARRCLAVMRQGEHPRGAGA